ncbi:MAG: COG1361 S-layer family protein [Lachnospiraceae bacterium]
MKRVIAGILCALLLLPAGNTVYAAQEQESAAKTQSEEQKTKAAEEGAQTEVPGDTENSGAARVILGGKEYDTPIANAGAECTLTVPVLNLSEKNVTDVVITPTVSSNVAEWPFEIEKSDYAQEWNVLEGTASKKNPPDRKHSFRWTLKTRKDAVTGYTKLTFQVSWVEADGKTPGSTTLEYYVQVNGVTPASEEGTETQGNVSTPRVIVTGFDTNPKEVYAGDTFKLTLHLKNTSKSTAVKNMLFDIQGTQEGSDAQTVSAAFLPTAGSSTIFVDSMGAGASKDITIEMKSKADLAQKPYVIDVNMEYEDSKANAFTETASVSIPIKQKARVDVSDITLMPEAAEIGNEVNVMFSIYNTGKTKLYNVSVKFEADSVSGGDTFLGNIESGATGNVDAYLTAQAATMDDGLVKIHITYEDEEGNPTTIEQQTTLYVSEPFMDDMVFDPEMDGMMMEEGKSNLPAIIAAVAAGILIIAGTVVVIRKKNKAKRLAQEELEIIEDLEDKE